MSKRDNGLMTALLLGTVGYVAYTVFMKPAAVPVDASGGSVVIPTGTDAVLLTLRPSFMNGLGAVETYAARMRSANAARPVSFTPNGPTNIHTSPGLPVATKPNWGIRSQDIPLAEQSKYSLSVPASSLTTSELAFIRANAGRPVSFKSVSGQQVTGTYMPSSNTTIPAFGVYYQGNYQGTPEQVRQSLIVNNMAFGMSAAQAAAQATAQLAKMDIRR